MKWLKENAFNIILLIGIIILAINQSKPIEFPVDEYTDDFCVEWEAGITRETLVYQCYNFIDQKVKCDWFILADDSIIITEYGNEKNIEQHLECVRYANTKIVETDGIVDPEPLEVEELLGE